MAIKQTCAEPGCSKIGEAEDKYCAAHARTVAQTRREFDAQRSKDPLRKLYHVALWTRTRDYVLMRDPICVECGTEGSTVVDHIVPAWQWTARGESFFDTDNLQGLCKPCHDSKTANECGWAGAHEQY